MDAPEATRRVPGPAAVFEQIGPNAGVSLDGFDVVRNGEVLRGAIELIESETVSFRVEYRKIGVVDPETDVGLRIVGAGPELETTVRIDTSQWRMGGAYAVDVPFQIPGFRYSGRATLYFLASSSDDSTARDVLWAAPVFVRPVIHRGDEDIRALFAKFGNEFAPLRKAMVLGPGASIDVPLAASTNTQALGLVTRMLYDHTIPQRAEVCRVEAMDESGQTLSSAALLAGVHTAQGDYDYYLAGAVRSKMIARFRSWDAGRPAANGKSYGRFLFWSELPIEIGDDARALRFTYLPATGIIEVREVLIKAIRP